MSEEKVEIKRFTLSEVSLLDSNKRYTVIRSETWQNTEYDQCIYKALEIPDDNDLIFYKERDYSTGSSWYRTPKYNDVLLIVKRSQNNNNDGFVNILVPRSIASVPCYTEKHSYSYNGSVRIGNVEVRCNYYTTEQHKLFKKEDGQFYFRSLGADFNIIKMINKNRNSVPADTVSELMLILKDVERKFDLSESLKDRKILNEIVEVLCTNVKTDLVITSKDGVSKTKAVIESFYADLCKTDMFASMCFKIIFEQGNKTLNSIRFSTIINKIFGNVSTQEEFNSKVENIAQIFLEETYFLNDFKSTLDKIINVQPDAREVKKAALKRKTSGAFNKIMDDIDFIYIDAEKYPLAHEAVHSGSIPLSTFFKKSGESYFVFNDNWELWEAMLTEYADIAYAISTEASKRTTYEKDLMSYFYFTLYALPEYLEKHTGKKWKGIPKLVSSSNELDPPKEGSNGVAKTRSALTPIVDNDKNEIVVPYVSMKIGGYQTTYCYGLNYQVLDRGFSFNGNVVTNSIEKELNGRDDYGLMFYTLTGSAQGQGYPTFLIIFERLDDKTKVHFHRTHPFRSKNGDYNPVHSWTKGCYKWMIGNVNFDKIRAQQGDLAFVEIDNFPDGEITHVNSYDNHMFANEVEFTPYVKKETSNVLGYVNLMHDTELKHNEHRNRIIPKGTYEIRQCRSWEANPKGIWSLRID